MNRCADREGTGGHCLAGHQGVYPLRQQDDKPAGLLGFQIEPLAYRKIAGDTCRAPSAWKATGLIG